MDPKAPWKTSARRAPPARSVPLPIGRIIADLAGPVRAMRWQYLPLMMVYFASGASGFTAIAESFWVKEQLGLSAESLVALTVWLGVPWTLKVVIGQLADSVPIFGSRRHAYVLAGAALMATSYVAMSGAAGGWIDFAPAEALYVAAAITAVAGLVVQDVVADAMSAEVVDRTDKHGQPRPEADVNADLGMVQVLGRLALMSGAFVVAGLGGWLAEILPYEQVFLLALAVPVISITGSLLVRTEVAERRPIDWRILGGGLAFAFITVILALSGLPYTQEIVFAVSMAIVTVLLGLTVTDLDGPTRRAIIFAAIIIFIFRATPTVGPGGQWWQIDVLGFDPSFFGTLAQIGAGLAIVGTWVFSRLATQRPVTTVLLWLTIIGAFLSLPTIGMYYGLHEWTERVFGFGARSIALVDTSLASPFAQLSMVPMLTLIAIHAPAGRRATWFALMASLMNLALQAGGLVTKYLNAIFVVQRGRYDELGVLMITVTLIGLAVPLIAIATLGPRLATRGTAFAQGPRSAAAAERRNGVERRQ
jgi:MFS family permease